MLPTDWGRHWLYTDVATRAQHLGRFRRGRRNTDRLINPLAEGQRTAIKPDGLAQWCIEQPPDQYNTQHNTQDQRLMLADDRHRVRHPLFLWRNRCTSAGLGWHAPLILTMPLSKSIWQYLPQPLRWLAIGYTSQLGTAPLALVLRWRFCSGCDRGLAGTTLYRSWCWAWV